MNKITKIAALTAIASASAFAGETATGGVTLPTLPIDGLVAGFSLILGVLGTIWVAKRTLAMFR